MKHGSGFQNLGNFFLQGTPAAENLARKRSKLSPLFSTKIGPTDRFNKNSQACNFAIATIVKVIALNSILSTSSDQRLSKLFQAVNFYGVFYSQTAVMT